MQFSSKKFKKVPFHGIDKPLFYFFFFFLFLRVYICIYKDISRENFSKKNNTFWRLYIIMTHYYYIQK